MSKKILIIDDSPTLRKLLNFYLNKTGYQVDLANNGAVGLKAIEKNQFDLVILDMNMPVMNGFEVLEELKTKKDFSVPILILSSNKEEQSKAAGSAYGASYYMTKPFKPEDVVTRIEKIFSEGKNL